MHAGDVVVLLIGIAVIALALADVFQSVVMPRAPTLLYRISLVVWRGLWRVWPQLAHRLYPRNDESREDFLASFAPFALIAMLATWVAILILGYGAILWATRREVTPAPHSYWDAAYFSGTSLLTIGFGDFVPRHGFARLIALCAAASGLGVVSVTTAYLFAIFGTFQRRESFIVMFAARAGSPPSAVGFFEIAAKTSTQQSLRTLMMEAQAWIAALMESHLAYPVLAFFRSSHDDQSWIGTLGALLDASLIANTMLDHGEHGEARICYAIGCHAVHDLSGYFRIGGSEQHTADISREDFDRACERLKASGYTLRERDSAWHELCSLRADYAGHLNAMASYFRIPAVAWLGERSLSGHVATHR